MSQTLFSLAGFQVIISGRFWVIAEAYRLFAVLVACMLQHGACGLRATATESVIELVDALSMWAVKADEDYAARVFVDRVHHGEHTRCLFRPVLIVITFRSPPFGREGAYRTVLGSLTSKRLKQRSCCAACTAAANPVSGHQNEVSILGNHDEEPT